MSAIHFSQSAVPARERPTLELNPSGAWVDPDTGIEAVGARTLTLGEYVEPYEVAKPGQRPEWVMLPVSALAKHEALAKLIAHPACVQLNGGSETEIRLPVEVWQEVSGLPIGASLPEIDGEGITQSVAAVERRHRAAKKALDSLTRDRNLVLLLATRAGKKRRELSEASGLSVARIQQLIEATAAELISDLDAFLSLVRVAFPEPDTQTTASELAHQIGGDHAEELIDHLTALRLLVSDGDRLALTDEGRAAADAVSPATADHGQSKE